VLFGSNVSHMATGSKKPTVESKALSIAIKRAMATRDLKTPGLASASTIPYGTLRKILELNTVADYEQLRKIAVALNIPLSEIVEDAERLASDPGVVDDFRESASSDTSKSPVDGMDDGERLIAEAVDIAKTDPMQLAAYRDGHKHDPDPDASA